MSLENNRTGPILPPDFGTEPYYISTEQYQELKSYIDPIDDKTFEGGEYKGNFYVRLSEMTESPLADMMAQISSGTDFRGEVAWAANREIFESDPEAYPFQTANDFTEQITRFSTHVAFDDFNTIEFDEARGMYRVPPDAERMTAASDTWRKEDLPLRFPGHTPQLFDPDSGPNDVAKSDFGVINHPELAVLNPIFALLDFLGYGVVQPTIDNVVGAANVTLDGLFRDYNDPAEYGNSLSELIDKFPGSTARLSEKGDYYVVENAQGSVVGYFGTPNGSIQVNDQGQVVIPTSSALGGVSFGNVYIYNPDTGEVFVRDAVTGVLTPASGNEVAAVATIGKLFTGRENVSLGLPPSSVTLEELKDAATNIPEQPDDPEQDWNLTDEQKEDAQQQIQSSIDENNEQLQDQAQQGIEDETAGNLEDSIKAGLLIDPSTIEPDWQLNEDTTPIEDDSYAVVEGDTVSTVMARMGLDYNNPEDRAAFMQANGLTEETVDAIGIGQELVRPEDNYHDLSVEERAAQMGMTVAQLEAFEARLYDESTMLAANDELGLSPKPLTDWEIAGVDAKRWGEIQKEAASGAQQGATNIAYGLQNGSDTQVAVGVLELLVNADILDNNFSLIDGAYIDNAQGGAQVLSSGMRLENALDADDTFCSFLWRKETNQRNIRLFSWPSASRKYSTLAELVATPLKHPRRQLQQASAFFGSFNGEYRGTLNG